MEREALVMSPSLFLHIPQNGKSTIKNRSAIKKHGKEIPQ